MKIYKIENWNLLKIELKEKEIENYKKKYMTYITEDTIIFNFDYNLAKPYIMRILQKKKFLDDYNKFTIIIVWLLVALFYVFTTLMTSSIKTEFNKIYDLLKINEKEAGKILDKYKEKKEIKTINPISNSVIIPDNNNNTWDNTIKKLK